MIKLKRKIKKILKIYDTISIELIEKIKKKKAEFIYLLSDLLNVVIKTFHLVNSKEFKTFKKKWANQIMKMYKKYEFDVDFKIYSSISLFNIGYQALYLYCLGVTKDCTKKIKRILNNTTNKITFNYLNAILHSLYGEKDYFEDKYNNAYNHFKKASKIFGENNIDNQNKTILELQIWINYSAIMTLHYASINKIEIENISDNQLELLAVIDTEISLIDQMLTIHNVNEYERLYYLDFKCECIKKLNTYMINNHYFYKANKLYDDLIAIYKEKQIICDRLYKNYSSIIEDQLNFMLNTATLFYKKHNYKDSNLIFWKSIQLGFKCFEEMPKNLYNAINDLILQLKKYLDVTITTTNNISISFREQVLEYLQKININKICYKENPQVSKGLFELIIFLINNSYDDSERQLRSYYDKSLDYFFEVNIEKN